MPVTFKDAEIESADGRVYVLNGQFHVRRVTGWDWNSWGKPAVDLVRVSGEGVSPFYVGRVARGKGHNLRRSWYDRKHNRIAGEVYQLVRNKGTLDLGVTKTKLRLGPSELCLLMDGSLTVGCHHVTAKQLAAAFPALNAHAKRHGLVRSGS